MTVEEFYQWCKENECTDYEIEVKYRDDGGEYYGSDEDIYLATDEDKKIITL